MQRTFVETFDYAQTGWTGWDGSGPISLEIRDGCAASANPWWVDYNHAPPGGGYLHILFVLYTHHGKDFSREVLQKGGPSAYVDGGYPTDLTDAKITARLKGDVNLCGAQLCLLAQGNVSDDPSKPNWVNQVLVAQPFQITPQWSEQTIHLVPDPAQWKNLGSRHDRQDRYGQAPIAELLKKVNGDLIFILYPLDIKPLNPLSEDPHLLRAGQDYEVDPARLPTGRVLLDEVRIEFSRER